MRTARLCGSGGRVMLLTVWSDVPSGGMMQRLSGPMFRPGIGPSGWEVWSRRGEVWHPPSPEQNDRNITFPQLRLRAVHTNGPLFLWKFTPFQDFEGQRRAERTFQVIIVLFAVSIVTLDL